MIKAYIRETTNDNGYWLERQLQQVRTTFTWLGTSHKGFEQEMSKLRTVGVLSHDSCLICSEDSFILEDE